MESAVRFVDSGDVNLWTEAFGHRSDTPLLLIMGAMNQGIAWPRPFCEQLAACGHFVIRYDHRDTGLSSVVDISKHPYTLAEMADDAWRILDAYEAHDAIVVGMSMGGYIAQLLAAERPGRVTRLVLLSTSADHRPYMAATAGCPLGDALLPPPAPRYLSYLTHAASQPVLTSADEMELRVEGWRATHGGSLPFPQPEVREMLEQSAARARDALSPFHHASAVAASPDRIALVRRIVAPTLVIHGEDDPCLPFEHGQFLAEAIPRAQLLALDMGHMLHPAHIPAMVHAIVALNQNDRTCC
ncbi:MAG: alpha/beta hydrolase [Dehalococcoidia bacterium]|nr:alpha/beta hydrolase [Dehalococcoidia bacterium]